MKLRFGFSPCPNDTIQFYALVNGLVDTEGYEFEPILEDVEALNLMALEGELELSKASYGLLGHVLTDYWCLRSGGALGRGCGPLWIAARPGPAEEYAEYPVAHPGVNTTAYLLLTLRTGGVEGVPMLFSDVMGAVASGEANSGVIIHEGRFTYGERGLFAVEDLGEWWERTTGAPIPLGCIMLKRDIPGGPDPLKVERWLRESYEYALANPEKVLEYVREHSQELSEEVVKSHIGLYVNEFSRDLGEEGEGAVLELMRRQRDLALIPQFAGEIFPPK
ncbi:MAG: 1,4-dihydroxy-6-naphthoate synthase [Deltaproteobacteria bacterium]|nr:MAG: 1,4-dihydroxy-6-naphthoate synthase [Deltaproteobacteria bacterium]